MVASNSQITDMPIFPDDLVPKFLQGMNMPVGWFPYIHGICIDNRGKPFIFFVSIDTSFGGPKFAFNTQGRTYTGNLSKSAYAYTNGVLSIGTKPKLTIDYHHPHKIRINVSSKVFVELYITYRGPPLWYSKGTNPADMVDLTPTCSIGGYDAPCRINGKAVLSESFSFSGYGDYGNIWLLGSLKWKEINSRWIVFNNNKSYGVAIKSFDNKTGATLASTGRFAIRDELALTFDDLEWVDDDRQPPRYVNVKGPVRDLNRAVKARVDLKTVRSVNLFVPSMWSQHRMAGSIDSTVLAGLAWCETRKPFRIVGSASIMMHMYDYDLHSKIAKLYYRFGPGIEEIADKHKVLRLILRTVFRSITRMLH